jgi:hypothetical protein
MGTGARCRVEQSGDPGPGIEASDEIASRSCSRSSARWREFRDPVDRITSDRMEEPTLNTNGWSVKELLRHMRCWNAIVADELQKI